MTDFQLSTAFTSEVVYIGRENTPLLIIDNLFTSPDELIELACDESDGLAFNCQANDYYPGIRKVLPKQYGQNICAQLLALIKTTFGFEQASSAQVLLSAFSISTTKPEQLRPIQTLPHFDTATANQLAMVHYLCGAEHGGTSFYRHRKSGYERISHERFAVYTSELKQQAIAEQLHKNPRYICGDNTLFEHTFAVEAKKNRAIIYPSNVLHSGNITPELGLSADPKHGRLTISSFLLIE